MKDITHVLKKQMQLLEIEVFNEKSSVYNTNKLKLAIKMLNISIKILEALEDGKAVWVKKSVRNK